VHDHGQGNIWGKLVGSPGPSNVDHSRLKFERSDRARKDANSYTHT